MLSIVEKEFVNFMQKFDENPYELLINGNSHQIGNGSPLFSVKVNKVPDMKDLLTSTSITLGEAYMDGDIEICGDLYSCLNMFLGQMGKFSTDRKKLKSLIFTIPLKEQPEKRSFFSL